MKKEFYNLKYGKCKLLDKKKDLYLVYAENCELHYIVCTYIDNGVRIDIYTRNFAKDDIIDIISKAKGECL